MTAIRGFDFGREVCEALGIPIKGITNIDISIPCDDAVRVDIRKYVSPESAKKITSIVKEYELHEKEKEKPTFHGGFFIAVDDAGIISDKEIKLAINKAKENKLNFPYELVISTHRKIDPDWLIHVTNEFFPAIVRIERENLPADQFILRSKS